MNVSFFGGGKHGRFSKSAFLRKRVCFSTWKGGNRGGFCQNSKSGSENSILMSVSFLEVENVDDFPKLLFSETGGLFFDMERWKPWRFLLKFKL